MVRHATIRRLLILKFSKVPGDFGIGSEFSECVSHFSQLNAIALVYSVSVLVIGCFNVVFGPSVCC